MSRNSRFQAPNQFPSPAQSMPGLVSRTTWTMTRGNQREQDRLKAQKKAAAQKKPKESAASLAKRREADADILRAKQKKKEEQSANAAAGGPSGK